MFSESSEDQWLSERNAVQIGTGEVWVTDEPNQREAKRLRPIDPLDHLVRRASAGDESAFVALSKVLKPLIFSVAREILRDTSEAEDMVQDVLLVVHQSLPSFRGDAKLTTWVHQIARNRSLNRLKYLKRRKWNMNLDISAPGMAGHICKQSQLELDEVPLERLHRKDAQRMVHQGLSVLSPTHRELIQMGYFEGLSYAQIAKRTGLRLGTIKSGLHRARRQLAQVLRSQSVDVKI